MNSELPNRIEIAGDRYWAIFNIPDKVVRQVKCAQVIAVPVGAPYIHRAVCFLDEVRIKSRKREDITGESVGKAEVRLLEAGPPFESFATGKYLARYTVSNFGEVRAFGKDAWSKDQKQDLLRTTTETERVEVTGVTVQKTTNETKRPFRSDNVTYVSWLGELVMSRSLASKGVAASKPRICDVHVQIGLPQRLVTPGGSPPKQTPLLPADFATPALGRILILNLGEIGETHRIRKSQSYEAIAVDLLRYLRSDREDPDPEKHGVLSQLSMFGRRDHGIPPWSILAVRLNNSAVFLYLWRNESEEKDAKGRPIVARQEAARIVCDRHHCAPLEAPEIGKMQGFTGFVSSHFATVAAELAHVGASDFDKLVDIAVRSVKSSLFWQRAAFERGLITLLFASDKKGELKPSPDYKHLFAELDRHVRRLERQKKTPENQVLSILVDINRAVAHRTPWFMARSVVSDKNNQPEQIENRFLRFVRPWLTEEDGNPDKSGVPIVRIGKLKLTDRREVEDYLAIHQALRLYGRSDGETKPLNIAVFGAPGAGKSFGVKEVVKHIGAAGEGKFQKKELEFNLGQFKSLDDLPAALHLVRNECLSGEIPVVVFDEFDSTFDGQPFGWLKYLLAPMQDGQFYDRGQTYKIGKAVFIFAGGVNRSFEELNGRMRNPGFCEAKGPDFISRLKAHLNIQGMNRPEDDGDQGRYVLRRGMLLYDVVRQRLGLKENERQKLLHPSVAEALLRLERFKHGVRSIESIIKMCSVRPGYPIGPSDLPSMEQMEMHVDASKLLEVVDNWQVANERLG